MSKILLLSDAYEPYLACLVAGQPTFGFQFDRPGRNPQTDSGLHHTPSDPRCCKTSLELEELPFVYNSKAVSLSQISSNLNLELVFLFFSSSSYYV